MIRRHKDGGGISPCSLRRLRWPPARSRHHQFDGRPLMTSGAKPQRCDLHAGIGQRGGFDWACAPVFQYTHQRTAAGGVHFPPPKNQPFGPTPPGGVWAGPGGGSWRCAAFGQPQSGHAADRRTRLPIDPSARSVGVRGGSKGRTGLFQQSARPKPLSPFEWRVRRVNSLERSLPALSGGMPGPVSHTSSRRLAPQRRAPSSTRPVRV